MRIPLRGLTLARDKPGEGSTDRLTIVNRRLRIVDEVRAEGERFELSVEVKAPTTV